MKLRLTASGENEYGTWKQFDRVMTNADSIRAMSDEELAEFLMEVHWETLPPREGWLDWLKQESKEWSLT